MSNSNTSPKATVGPSMRRLRHAFEPLMQPAIAESFAFHLAELKPELKRMVNLLEEVEKTEKVTPHAAKKILYFVESHWPYHFKALKKLATTPTLVRYAESLDQ